MSKNPAYTPMSDAEFEAELAAYDRRMVELGLIDATPAATEGGSEAEEAEEEEPACPACDDGDDFDPALYEEGLVHEDFELEDDELDEDDADDSYDEVAEYEDEDFDEDGNALSGNALIDAFFSENSDATGVVAEGDDPETNPNIHPATYEGPFKSGFVSLVGRPNAGKSTLINAILGEKVLITSPTAQTTRHRISAIYNEPHMQIVLVDTPGLHKPVDALGEELNISALNALKDVDVVAMIVDGTQEAGRGDEWVAQHVAEAKARKILVVSKADCIDQEKAQAQVDRMFQYCQFDDVIVLSAKENFNVDSFLCLVAKRLPEGPRWFPTDMQTDQRIEVIIAEFIREKVLLNTRDEVPHSVGVTVDYTRYDEEKDISVIKATVYVEREGQKGIVIGAGGKMIKRIGSQARRDLQRLLGNQVFLDLNVKVKSGWRTDAAQIKRFGYGEGA